MTENYMENVSVTKTITRKTETGLLSGFNSHFNNVLRGGKIIGYISAFSDIGFEPERYEVRDPSLHVHEVTDTREEAIELIARLSIERPDGWNE